MFLQFRKLDTVRRACKKAGIRTLSAHSLRHRKGYQISDENISPTIGAIMRGHEDPQTTMDSCYRKEWDAAERAFERLFTEPEKLTGQPSKVVQCRIPPGALTPSIRFA